MPTCAHFWAVFHGEMWPSGDGLPRSYWHRGVPAKRCGGVRLFTSGVVSVSWISFVLVQYWVVPLSKGTMGSMWEHRHLTGLPGGGGAVYRLCPTPMRVNTVWIKQHKTGPPLQKVAKKFNISQQCLFKLEFFWLFIFIHLEFNNFPVNQFQYIMLYLKVFFAFNIIIENVFVVW